MLKNFFNCENCGTKADDIPESIDNKKASGIHHKALHFGIITLTICVTIVMSSCNKSNPDSIDNMDTEMYEPSYELDESVSSITSQKESKASDNNEKVDENSTTENKLTTNTVTEIRKIPLYKTISKYSSDGALLQRINCEYDDVNRYLVCSIEGSNQRYEFGYDAYGRLIEEKTFNENDALVNWTEYDSNGAMITNITYSDDGSKYFGSYQSQYDENGMIEQKIEYVSSSGDYSISQYEDGKVTKQTRYNINDDVVSYTTMEYDVNGNVIKLTDYRSDGSVSGYIICEYDSYGSQTSYIMYDDQGEEKFSIKNSYEYDKEGRIIKKYDGVNGYLEMEWTYDTDGNILMEKQYNSNGIVTLETGYNKKERVSRDINYGDDGAILAGQEVSYDNNGFPDKIKRYSYGRLISEEQYIYKMASDDQVASVEVISLPSGDMMGKQEYQYDSDGCLVSAIMADHFGNKAVIEYQLFSFQVQGYQFDTDIQTASQYGGQYAMLISLDSMADTSKYYDYLLCSGDGYMLVAKEKETVNDIEDFIGVLDVDYNWVIPLSSDTPLHNNNGRLEWNGLEGYFDKACDDLENQFHYAGDGAFIWADWHFPAKYYNGKMLLVEENKWVDLGNFDSSLLTFTNGCLVTVDCERQNEDNVKIIYSSGEVVPLDIYCRRKEYLGQYREGLFFAYDGFYNLDGERIIDLSEYAGKINNQPYFKDGKCKLYAENENGTIFTAEIDKNGNFITEFTKAK